jgi:poly(hydroxyalkanoate) granule-associated protein
MATKAASKPSAKTASKSAKSQANTKSNDPLHSTASKDIWLAGLGAMAQAQAQARAQGSKAFEALVADGLAFQRKSQAAAQEKLHEATAHFNQLAQGITSGINTTLVQPVGVKVDRLEHMFEDRVARALKSLGLPTAQDVTELQERVAVLEAALEAALKDKQPQTAPRKRASSTAAKAKR